MADEQNGGLRPVPDPTVLTTEQLVRSERATREYVNGEIGKIEERLNGIDKATGLRLETVHELPGIVDEKVGHLEALVGEKFEAQDALITGHFLVDNERFASIQTQFSERDTRQEREARDNKVAVDAAFAAQKEAAAKQDESNQKAIDKSERGTNDTIKTLADANQQVAVALGDKIDDLKERVGRVESLSQGRIDQRAETRSVLTSGQQIGTVILAAVALLIGILTYSTLHKAQSPGTTQTVVTVSTVTTEIPVTTGP